MKKIWMLLLLLTLSAVVLAGCSGSADTLPTPTTGTTDMAPQASPGATTGTDGLMDGLMPGSSDSPDANDAPAVGAGAGAGITSIDDARKASEDMEDAVGKLSEVDDAYVVAVGNTAVVGVKFNSQYQGGIDDRMKGMVLTRVQTVNKNVTAVAVTDDAKQVQEIQSLAQSLESATSLSAVSTQAQELAGQIQVYKE